MKKDNIEEKIDKILKLVESQDSRITKLEKSFVEDKGGIYIPSSKNDNIIKEVEDINYPLSLMKCNNIQEVLDLYQEFIKDDTKGFQEDVNNLSRLQKKNLKKWQSSFIKNNYKEIQQIAEEQNKGIFEIILHDFIDINSIEETHQLFIIDKDFYKTIVILLSKKSYFISLANILKDQKSIYLSMVEFMMKECQLMEENPKVYEFLSHCRHILSHNNEIYYKYHTVLPMFLDSIHGEQHGYIKRNLLFIAIAILLPPLSILFNKEIRKDLIGIYKLNNKATQVDLLKFLIAVYRMGFKSFTRIDLTKVQEIPVDKPIFISYKKYMNKQNSIATSNEKKQLL